MNLRSFRLRAIGPPLAVAAISAAALVWFDRIWIPTQQQYVNERSLRALRTISVQIKAKVDNFDQAIDHAIDSFRIANEDDDLLQKYVKLFSPELEIVTLSPKHPAWANVTAGNPPNVRIQRDEGHNYLYLGYQHDQGHRKERPAVRLIARGDLDKVTEAPLSGGDFDALLLLDARGNTITRRSPSGLELTSLAKVSDRGPAVAGRASVFERMRGTTGLAVVTVGAADYMLYTQPIQLSLSHDPKDGAQGAEEWMLCGLVRLDRFRAGSSTIPTTYWLCFGAALALICFAMPVVKLHVLSPRERLTRFDSVAISAAIFMLMALAAFAVQDLRTFGFLVPAAIDDQLRSVAGAMLAHVRLEAAAVDRQIKVFAREEVWRRELGYRRELYQSLTDIRQHLEPRPGADINLDTGADSRSECEPSWSCRLGVLTQLGDIDYPFFKLMVWSDAEGWQRIKWSTSRFITPFINVTDAKLAYSGSLKLARRLSLTSEPVPKDGVVVMTSPNTGEKLTVFWRALPLLPGDETAEGTRVSALPAKPDLTGVTLATTPVSLTNPVLPKHVQFAVVDRSGQVLFHNDPSRSLAENMFQECEDNPALRSLVTSRDSGAITARYLGRPHRLFVTPLDVAPFGDQRWSLVIFQASAVSETANLQTVNLAASLFTVYALALAFCWMLLSLVRPGAIRRLCWPTGSRAPGYRRAALVGAATALACLSAPAAVPAAMLVPVTAALVASGLTAMTILVRATHLPSASSSTWAFDFMAARASLLLLLAAAPATLCFQVAFAFHSDLVAKRGETHLASELGARARRINVQAQNVALCAETDPGWQQCARVGTFVARRTNATLWDIGVPAEAAAADPQGQNAAVAPQALRSFLRRAYRPYNDIAADLLLGSAARSRPGAERWRIAVDGNGTEVFGNGPALVDRRFVSAIAPRPTLDAASWLIVVVLAAAAYVLVRYLLRPIFAMDLTPAPLLLAAAGGADDTSLLVLGLPGARRTDRLLRHPRVRVFDVRSLSFADDPALVSVVADVHSAAADSGLGEAPAHDWREAIELAALHPLTIVAVDHLEHRLDDAGFREAMLECLESLVYRHGATVWCSAVREPIHLLEDIGAPAGERHRWTCVFESFRRERLGLEGGGPRAAALADRLGPYPSLSPEVRGLIVSECAIAPELLTVAEHLVDRLPPNTALTGTQALDELERGAEPFYRSLWRACATDERLALRQLAEEGLVNPNNRSAIVRLLNAGLVRRGQTFRVMNETFRRFVIGAESHDVISAWEREGVRVPWGTIATTGVTVAFGLAGLLLLTQEQLVDAWISYVPALAPAIPTVWKMLASVQKGRLELAA